MSKNEESTAEASLRLIGKAVSEGFRYAIPGIVALLLIKLARPNLFIAMGEVIGRDTAAWAVAAVATGMIAQACHRSALFLIDVLFLFSTGLTAVAEFRKDFKECDRLGPWVAFLRHKYKKEPEHKPLLSYFSFRWSMGHAITNLGEVGLVLTSLAKAGSPLAQYCPYTYFIFAIILIFGIATLLLLHWTERRLYQQIK